jgi:hypothetical protein
MSDDKAMRILPGLRAGLTLRQLGDVPRRFNDYCDAHPEYAREARPLEEANAAAARRRKGDSLRTTTHCRAGLHLMTGDNVIFDGTYGRKRCLACRRGSSARAPLMSIEVADRVKLALQRGASIGQITQGKPAGGGEPNRSLYITSFKIIKRYRQENPEFDRFVTAAIADSNAVGQRIHFQRKLNAARREQVNDYHKIRAMLPANFPDKDDVVSDIFEAILNGSLRREDVGRRVRDYIRIHNRALSTQYPKFAGRPLSSLDAPLFADGTMTLGETITRGLWD